LEIENLAGLQAMVDSGMRLSSIIAALATEILVAPSSRSFLLSDRPFVVVPPRGVKMEGVGVLSKGAIKLLPLTSRLCLRLGESGLTMSRRNIAGDLVRIVNLNVARNSERFIYGGSQALVESIVERAGVQKPSAETPAEMSVIREDDDGQWQKFVVNPLRAFYHDQM
jgi:hypothetical protein